MAKRTERFKDKLKINCVVYVISFCYQNSKVAPQIILSQKVLNILIFGRGCFIIDLVIR